MRNERRMSWFRKRRRVDRPPKGGAVRSSPTFTETTIATEDDDLGRRGSLHPQIPDPCVLAGQVSPHSVFRLPRQLSVSARKLTTAGNCSGMTPPAPATIRPLTIADRFEAANRKEVIARMPAQPHRHHGYAPACIARPGVCQPVPDTQDVVDYGLVLERDDLDLLGHREHNMEVRHVSGAIARASLDADSIVGRPEIVAPCIGGSAQSQNT